MFNKLGAFSVLNSSLSNASGGGRDDRYEGISHEGAKVLRFLLREVCAFVSGETSIG